MDPFVPPPSPSPRSPLRPLLHQLFLLLSPSPLFSGNNNDVGNNNKKTNINNNDDDITINSYIDDTNNNNTNTNNNFSIILQMYIRREISNLGFTPCNCYYS